MCVVRDVLTVEQKLEGREKAYPPLSRRVPRRGQGQEKPKDSKAEVSLQGLGAELKSSCTEGSKCGTIVGDGGQDDTA